jgi:hypothetical protein
VSAARRGSRRSRGVAGVVLSAALGAAAALLVSCGSSAKLIPVANSEPLQADFEEVARDAEAAHGSCAATETAVRKAEHDLATLPASVDAGLRRHLVDGLDRLRSDALELCAQPSTSSTTAPATTQPAKSTTKEEKTTPTNKETTTPTGTTNTTSTTNTQTGGGTPAKEREAEEAPGKKEGKDNGGDGGAGGAAPEGGGGK